MPASKNRRDDRQLLVRMIEESYRLTNWNGTGLRSALTRVTPSLAAWFRRRTTCPASQETTSSPAGVGRNRMRLGGFSVFIFDEIWIRKQFRACRPFLLRTIIMTCRMRNFALHGDTIFAIVKLRKPSLVHSSRTCLPARNPDGRKDPQQASVV